MIQSNITPVQQKKKSSFWSLSKFGFGAVIKRIQKQKKESEKLKKSVSSKYSEEINNGSGILLISKSKSYDKLEVKRIKSDNTNKNLNKIAFVEVDKIDSFHSFDWQGSENMTTKSGHASFEDNNIVKKNSFDFASNVAIYFKKASGDEEFANDTASSSSSRNSLEADKENMPSTDDLNTSNNISTKGNERKKEVKTKEVGKVMSIDRFNCLLGSKKAVAKTLLASVDHKDILQLTPLKIVKRTDSKAKVSKDKESNKNEITSSSSNMTNSETENVEYFDNPLKNRVKTPNNSNATPSKPKSTIVISPETPSQSTRSNIFTALAVNKILLPSRKKSITTANSSTFSVPLQEQAVVVDNVDIPAVQAEVHPEEEEPHVSIEKTNTNDSAVLCSDYTLIYQTSGEFNSCDSIISINNNNNNKKKNVSDKEKERAHLDGIAIDLKNDSVEFLVENPLNSKKLKNPLPLKKVHMDLKKSNSSSTKGQPSPEKASKGSPEKASKGSPEKASKGSSEKASKGSPEKMKRSNSNPPSASNSPEKTNKSSSPLPTDTSKEPPLADQCAKMNSLIEQINRVLSSRSESPEKKSTAASPASKKKEQEIVLPPKKETLVKEIEIVKETEVQSQKKKMTSATKIPIIVRKNGVETPQAPQYLVPENDESSPIPVGPVSSMKTPVVVKTPMNYDKRDFINPDTEPVSGSFNRYGGYALPGFTPNAFSNSVVASIRNNVPQTPKTPTAIPVVAKSSVKKTPYETARYLVPENNSPSPEFQPRQRAQPQLQQQQQQQIVNKTPFQNVRIVEQVSNYNSLITNQQTPKVKSPQVHTPTNINNNDKELLSAISILQASINNKHKIDSVQATPKTLLRKTPGTVDSSRYLVPENNEPSPINIFPTLRLKSSLKRVLNSVQNTNSPTPTPTTPGGVSLAPSSPNKKTPAAPMSPSNLYDTAFGEDLINKLPESLACYDRNIVKIAQSKKLSLNARLDIMVFRITVDKQTRWEFFKQNENTKKSLTAEEQQEYESLKADLMKRDKLIHLLKEEKWTRKLTASEKSELQLLKANFERHTKFDQLLRKGRNFEPLSYEEKADWIIIFDHFQNEERMISLMSREAKGESISIFEKVEVIVNKVEIEKEMRYQYLCDKGKEKDVLSLNERSELAIIRKEIDLQAKMNIDKHKTLTKQLRDGKYCLSPASKSPNGRYHSPEKHLQQYCRNSPSNSHIRYTAFKTGLCSELGVSEHLQSEVDKIQIEKSELVNTSSPSKQKIGILSPKISTEKKQRLEQLLNQVVTLREETDNNNYDTNKNDFLQKVRQMKIAEFLKKDQDDNYNIESIDVELEMNNLSVRQKTELNWFLLDAEKQYQLSVVKKRNLQDFLKKENIQDNNNNNNNTDDHIPITRRAEIHMLQNELNSESRLEKMKQDKLKEFLNKTPNTKDNINNLNEFKLEGFVSPKHKRLLELTRGAGASLL